MGRMKKRIKKSDEKLFIPILCARKDQRWAKKTSSLLAIRIRCFNFLLPGCLMKHIRDESPASASRRIDNCEFIAPTLTIKEFCSFLTIKHRSRTNLAPLRQISTISLPFPRRTSPRLSISIISFIALIYLICYSTTTLSRIIRSTFLTFRFFPGRLCARRHKGLLRWRSLKRNVQYQLPSEMIQCSRLAFFLFSPHPLFQAINFDDSESERISEKIQVALEAKMRSKLLFWDLKKGNRVVSIKQRITILGP